MREGGRGGGRGLGERLEEGGSKGKEMREVRECEAVMHRLTRSTKAM